MISRAFLAAALQKKVWSDPTDITADNFVLPAGAVDGQMDVVVKANTEEGVGTGAVTLTSTDGTRTSVATLPAVGHRLGEVYDEIRVNEKLHIQRINNDGDAVLETPIVTPISIPIVTNGIADTVFRAWQNGSVSVEYEGTLPTVNYKYPLEFENLLTNGDFKNGTTGWAAYNSTISASSGTLQLTQSSTISVGYATQDMDFVTGHVYYFRANYELLIALNDASCYVGIRTSKSSSGNVVFAKGALPVGAKGTVSTSITIGGGMAEYSLCTHNSTTPSVCKFSDSAVIDLTALFGAGKEPSLAWCDANIAPNIKY